MIETFVSALLHFLESIGYPGIFFISALESTFLPIPSELTMIPTGYLIYQGKMGLIPAFFSTISGTVCGSLVNYWIAYRFGRRLLIGHGKYFMMNEEKLQKMETFFQKHGPVSIFAGRLVFGVRHYISFPAGLARMDLKKFCLYTAAGGSLWISILLGLGYAAGGNEAFLHKAVPAIKIGIAAAVALGIYIYVQKNKKAALEKPR